MGRALAVPVVICAAVLGTHVKAEDVTLAVASNFIPALTALAPRIEAETGAELRVVNGSTGKLYTQIIQGAPFDLFLAADEDHIARYSAQFPEKPAAIYAIGKLAQAKRKGAPSLKTARIAIADPTVAPYGVAALQALAMAGENPEELDLIYGPNVSAVVGFLLSGNVDIAYVSASQLSYLNGFESEVLPNIEIPQAMALLTDNASARAVFDILLSPSMRANLPELGYTAPEGDL